METRSRTRANRGNVKDVERNMQNNSRKGRTTSRDHVDASEPPRKKRKAVGRQICDLPPEIIVHILSYLPLRDVITARGVCKAWNGIFKNPSLWKAVEFDRSLKVKVLTNARLWKKLKRMGTTCVRFNHQYFDMLGGLEPFVMQRLKELKSVTALFLNSVSKGNLDYIVEHMPQLKVLHVDCLSPSSNARDLGDASFFFNWDCLGALSCLEDLKLTSFHTLCKPTFSFSTGKTLADLGNLKKLVLTNLDSIKDDQLVFLEKLNHLESLELGNFASNCTFAHLAPPSLSGLKSLSLTQAHCRCDQNTCHCLVPALQNLTSLEKLTLKMCMIPETLKRSLRTMKHLRSLEIWPYLDRFYPSYDEIGLTKNVVDTFLSQFKRLKHLREAKIGILENFLVGFLNPFHHSWADDQMQEQRSDYDDDSDDGSWDICDYGCRCFACRFDSDSSDSYYGGNYYDSEWSMSSEGDVSEDDMDRTWTWTEPPSNALQSGKGSSTKDDSQRNSTSRDEPSTSASQDNKGTVASQDNKGTVASQDNKGTVASQDNKGTLAGQDNESTTTGSDKQCKSEGACHKDGVTKDNKDTPADPENQSKSHQVPSSSALRTTNTEAAIHKDGQPSSDDVHKDNKVTPSDQTNQSDMDQAPPPSTSKTDEEGPSVNGDNQIKSDAAKLEDGDSSSNEVSKVNKDTPLVRASGRISDEAPSPSALRTDNSQAGTSANGDNLSNSDATNHKSGKPSSVVPNTNDEVISEDPGNQSKMDQALSSDVLRRNSVQLESQTNTNEMPLLGVLKKGLKKEENSADQKKQSSTDGLKHKKREETSVDHNKNIYTDQAPPLGMLSKDKNSSSADRDKQSNSDGGNVSAPIKKDVCDAQVDKEHSSSSQSKDKDIITADQVKQSIFKRKKHDDKTNATNSEKVSGDSLEKNSNEQSISCKNGKGECSRQSQKDDSFRLKLENLHDPEERKIGDCVSDQTKVERAYIDSNAKGKQSEVDESNVGGQSCKDDGRNPDMEDDVEESVKKEETWNANGEHGEHGSNQTSKCDPKEDTLISQKLTAEGKDSDVLLFDDDGDDYLDESVFYKLLGDSFQSLHPKTELTIFEIEASYLDDRQMMEVFDIGKTRHLFPKECPCGKSHKVHKRLF